MDRVQHLHIDAVPKREASCLSGILSDGEKGPTKLRMSQRMTGSKFRGKLI